MFKDRKARTAAVKALAETLNVSERTVRARKIVGNALESVKNREISAENARKHREKCENLAKMVKNRQISLKRAAFEADISERQLRRYIAALEGK